MTVRAGRSAPPPTSLCYIKSQTLNKGSMASHDRSYNLKDSLLHKAYICTPSTWLVQTVFMTQPLQRNEQFPGKRVWSVIWFVIKLSVPGLMIAVTPAQQADSCPSPFSVTLNIFHLIFFPSSLCVLSVPARTSITDIKFHFSHQPLF